MGRVDRPQEQQQRRLKKSVGEPPMEERQAERRPREQTRM